MDDFLEYELRLSIELEVSLGSPVDVTVLNNAPPAFKYRVLGGEPLMIGAEKAWLEFYDLTVR